MTEYYELEQEINYLDEIIETMGDSEASDNLREIHRRLLVILSDLRSSRHDLELVIKKINDVLINR